MPWLFPSLRGYQRGWLRSDVLAALTVWAVLVPEALAYASIAGVSPVIGLYAAPGALILYAALGSSRVLITGPGAATAALSAATVADLVPVGSDGFVAMTAALAITTGLAAMLAGLLRLGFLANFISEPVLKGFIVGLALTIMIGQVPELLGISQGAGDFFEQLWHVVTHLGEAQGATVLVGGLSLALILLLRRFASGLPGALIAAALGVLAVKVLNLADHGVVIVGPIASGLPDVGVPDVSLHDVGTLAAGAVGIMLISFAEGLGAAKTYAGRDDAIDANRELLGLGGANLAAGLSAGMVVNGSLSKTAVNAGAKARTQMPGLIVAALTIVTILALTGLFEDLPEATLAAIVIAAVIELVDVPGLVELYRAYSARLGREFGFVARPDFIGAVAALFGVLIFDTLPGLFIGITVSLLLLLYRDTNPYVATLGRLPGPDGHWRDVDRHPDAAPTDGVAVLRVEGDLYFANAEAVRTRILHAAEAEGITAVVIDAETVPFIDVTAVRMIAALTEELRSRNVRLIIARDTGQVRDLLRSVVDQPDLARSYTSVQEGVEAALRRRGG